MACKAARPTDEYHGWECEITEGVCMLLIPDSKACAEKIRRRTGFGNYGSGAAGRLRE